MDVFDSSIWLLALLSDEPEPNRLVREVVTGARRVAIDPYIHEEVSRNVEEAAISETERRDRLELLNSTLRDLDNVLYPTYQELGTMNIESVRARAETELLHCVLDIQTKDVPIAVFAYDLIRADLTRTVTIYTADEGFGELDPSNHDIPRLTVAYVPV